MREKGYSGDGQRGIVENNFGNEKHESLAILTGKILRFREKDGSTRNGLIVKYFCFLL